jgi:transcriptional regulator with XRE-family HTH domain
VLLAFRCLFFAMGMTKWLTPAMEFGDWLKREREAKGLTREQLAAAAGVSVAQIFNLETGRAKRPRIDTVRRLRTAIETRKGPRCSFCGRHEDEIRWLVSSPKDENAAICDTCVRRVVALISNNARRHAEAEQVDRMLSLVRE